MAPCPLRTGWTVQWNCVWALRHQPFCSATVVVPKQSRIEVQSSLQPIGNVNRERKVVRLVRFDWRCLSLSTEHTRLSSRRVYLYSKLLSTIESACKQTTSSSPTTFFSLSNHSELPRSDESTDSYLSLMIMVDDASQWRVGRSTPPKRASPLFPASNCVHLRWMNPCLHCDNWPVWVHDTFALID